MASVDTTRRSSSGRLFRDVARYTPRLGLSIVPGTASTAILARLASPGEMVATYLPLPGDQHQYATWFLRLPGHASSPAGVRKSRSAREAPSCAFLVGVAVRRDRHTDRLCGAL